jgi:hypothetical protein
MHVRCLLFNKQSSICDRTTSEMRGSLHQDQSGDSRRSENIQTHKQVHKTMIKVEIKLLQLKFKVYKILKQMLLQKIEHISGSIYLDGIRTFTSS